MKPSLFLLLTINFIRPCLIYSELEVDSAPENDDSLSFRSVFYAPEMYEYDPFTFDPSNSMGSPYGGYARATMSRLAALPLRLVGSSTDFSSSFLGLDSDKGPYFSIYDAHAHLLACRVYDQEELSVDSITDSMLDLAEEASSSSLSSIDPPLADENSDSDHPTEATQTPNRSSATIHHYQQIQTQLDKLKGICSQLNLGYWNYQWCHEQNLLQFHTVQDLTLVGLYDHHSRRIMTKAQHNGKQTAKDISEDVLDTSSPQQDTTSAPLVHSGRVLVQESFIQGDYCSAAQKVRDAKVTLRCCKLEEWMSVVGIQELGLDLDNFDNDQQGQNVMAQILQIDEATTCSYTAVICTNVLCHKSFHGLNHDPLLLEDDDDEEEEEEEEDDDTPSGEITSKLQTGPFRPIQRFNKDESIRNILQLTLNQCLTFQSGWWTYSFCYGQGITQFHLDLQFDSTILHGASNINVEKQGQHVLGLYNTKTMNTWTKEDEINHVVRPNQHTHPSIHTTKYQAFSDGNGAYYVEEYLNGDLCNHEDVTGSAITGGTNTQGAIQRSSVVRFSCGKELKLLRVYEDSTCKYVLDVTVPELCFHSLFEAQSVHTQVVKCLPIGL